MSAPQSIPRRSRSSTSPSSFAASAGSVAVRGEPGFGLADADFGAEPHGRSGDLRGLFAGGRRVAHRGVELREPAVLEVRGPLRRDRLVQILPHTRERLLPLLGFFAQPLAVRPGQCLQEPLIEGVAVAGDSRNELRERDRRVVIRSARDR